MIASVKIIQLLTSVAFVALVWMVYPGGTALLATGVALAYVAAAVLAMLDYRVGIWLAFVFSLLTAAFTSYGVYRYVRNGFDFLTGTYGRLDDAYLPPYLFVLVASGSIAVVLMHAKAGRWLLGGTAAAERAGHRR